MTRVSIRALLARSPSNVILLDGGTGSSMEDRGFDVRSDLWSSAALLTQEGRDATRRLHADFITSGADVVIANTHNVCPETCRAFLESQELASLDIPPAIREGDDADRAELFLVWIEQLGIELACEAVPDDRDVVVAAGIGSQEPWAKETERSREGIEASLGPCARALGDSSETFVLFETLSTPPEVEAVAELARTPGVKDFGIGLSCGPDGCTWGGVSMDEAVRAFEGTSVAALFVQCTRYDLATLALQNLLEAMGRASELDAVPGVYANDGRVWKDRRWQGERVSPQAYADAAEEWREAGARIIGGCCGTTTEHVAELRRRWPSA